MKLKLYYIGSKNPSWAEEIAQEYDKKLSQFGKFERILLKSPSLERKSQEQKRETEGELLLKKIEPNEFLLLLDERGKKFENSQALSECLVKIMSGSQSTVTFVIGGPYGFSKAVRDRANESWSLSNLTMNHHVAQVAFLEQLYRCFAIWKNLPYHNA